MIFGYARVSTAEQNVDIQIDALMGANCERIYQEKISGKSTDRPELKALLGQLRHGDVVVVYKMDRLARSLSDLVAIMSQLEKLGVGFKSLTEAMDLSTAAGRMQMGLFAVVAEFERELIRERTMAGLAHARQNGRIGGRPKALNDKDHKRLIDRSKKSDLTVSELAAIFKVSASTVKRILKADKA